MAMADYRLCDKCGGKSFYDSNLGYDFEHHHPHGVDGGVGPTLPGLGDWAVLCPSCAMTHKCIVVEREVPLVRVEECPEGVKWCNAVHVKAPAEPTSQDKEK